MPFKLIEEHEDGETFKEIASANDVDFSRGLGYYQLTKKEKVSASKALLMYKGNKLFSEDAAAILTQCGLKPNAENNIEPKHIPTGFRLFVQSTSPNRKISEEAAVVFVVDQADDDDEEGGDDGEENGEEEDEDENGRPGKRQKIESDGLTWAIKFDEFIAAIGEAEEPEEMECDELDAYFTGEVGTMFSDCDHRVPERALQPAIYRLSQLFRVEWDEASVLFEIHPEEGQVTRASAKGTLWRTEDFHDYDTNKSRYQFNDAEIPVRIFYDEVLQLFAVAYANEWGALFGSPGEHPLVYCNEIRYDNSDGSSNQPYFKSELPPTASVTAKMNEFVAFQMKWFLNHCTDANH